MHLKFVKFNYNENELIIWNNFTLKFNKNFNLSFNPSLLKVLSGYYKLQISYYFIYNSKRLIGLIPGFIYKNKFISMPVLTSAGILLEKKYDKIFILNQFIDFIQKDFIIKDFEPLSKFNYSIKKTVLLRLKDNSDEMLLSFRSKLRSDIKKSLKNNLEFVMSDIKDLKNFYSIYSKSLHNLGTPVNSFNYFKFFFENYKYGIKKILLVKYKNNIVGSSIIFSYNNVLEIFWAATNSKFNYLKPNIFMYWNLIKYSIDNNFKCFSFGRSTKESGSLKFKKQWDTKDNGLIIEDIYVSSNNRIKEPKYNLLINIWKYIPYSLTKILGPLVRSKIIN